MTPIRPIRTEEIAVPTVTRFPRSATATAVPGDAVYLSYERAAQIRLQGELVERLAPLLDGTRSRDEVVAALEGVVDPARTERALGTLIGAGHVVEVDPAIDERVGGYWDAAGVAGDAAVAALASTAVELVTVGGIDAHAVAAFTAAARGVGLRIADGGSDDAADAAVSVVLTDDYLAPELASVNARHLRSGRPWLLVKPVGTTVWLGPIVDPGVTACYECLHTRLSGKSMLVSYLRQREVVGDSLVTSRADLPGTVAVAAQLAALHAAKWVTGVFQAARGGGDAPSAFAPAREAEVVTVDTVNLQLDHHRLDRRPQCKACGDPDRQAAWMRRPVELTSRTKIASTDGGHRARDPQTFLDEYSTLVSPVTGPISSLVKVPLEVEGLHTYTAGQNFAVPMSNANDLRAGLRSASAGKGISDQQARASALGEAIERYSGVFHGDEATRVASFEELGDDAVEPNALHLYSDRQFAERAAWNARPSHFHWVADRLDPTEPVEWSPVWSMTEQRHRWAPTSALYFSYRNPRFPFQAGANSNGCAAGSSLEDAIVQGFMELVERDSVAMWWYHRLSRPRIDLDSFDVPYFATWQQRYEALDRETWVLDVTNDLGIPSVVAVSYRRDKPAQDILFALGAHFDVEVAIGRALSEMNQFLPAVVGMKPDGSGTYAYNDPVQLDWWANATVADQPYLLPASGQVLTRDDYRDLSTTDLRDDVELARSIVEQRGLEMLVLDQTRVDIGLPVARVIVPGLRHFWPRYAPGRLFDVPEQLGWTPAGRTEDDLNPIAMFL